MLTHLTIQNYALISHLDIIFGNGFSVLTGETGAGKSIILGALNLVMGGRADSKAITDGESKCVIEAEFDITSCGLEPLFEENDLDYYSICTIRRELFSTGKSRSFVNDSPISLAILKELSKHLIDIHSQHENLLIGSNEFQLQVIDTLAHNDQQKNAYEQAFIAYETTAKELVDLQRAAQKAKDETDYIAFQYNQLEEANIQPNEIEDLEVEEHLLTHAEDIKSALLLVSESIHGDIEQNVLSVLKEGLQACNKIKGYLPQENSLPERINNVYIELQDLAHEAERLAERTEFDSQRMQFVSERLDMLNTLLQKHHVKHTSELIELHKQLADSLQRLTSYDEEIASLSRRLDEEKKALVQRGLILTKSRNAVSNNIAKQIETDLQNLGVIHAKIRIDINELADFTINGKDDVQFMFAANLNQSVQRVYETASGGEMSRLMLCIKSLIANSKGLPTIIFDEIDTGVSGEIAKKMGSIMKQIAKGRQVLAITHLPQIAAQGDIQYEVYKSDTKIRTETNIRKLNEEDRVDAIAHMFTGKNLTTAARENARELLEQR